MRANTALSRQAYCVSGSQRAADCDGNTDHLKEQKRHSNIHAHTDWIDHAQQHALAQSDTDGHADNQQQPDANRHSDNQ